ncbi:hypothetical protein Tco_0808199 [Tanacetum coccineum]
MTYEVILFGVILLISLLFPEDSLPPIPDLPLVSPFLCSDDTEADGESEPAEQRPVSSSHDTLAPLSEFPLAPVVAPPGIPRRPAILVDPVRPIPARRLSWRRVSHHSSDRHSSPDLSSSSAPSDHSLIQTLTTRHTMRCRFPPLRQLPSPTHVSRSISHVGISEGVVAHPKDGVGMGFEIAASDVREDDEEFEAEASAAKH